MTRDMRLALPLALVLLGLTTVACVPQAVVVRDRPVYRDQVVVVAPQPRPVVVRRVHRAHPHTHVVRHHVRHQAVIHRPGRAHVSHPQRSKPREVRVVPQRRDDVRPRHDRGRKVGHERGNSRHRDRH